MSNKLPKLVKSRMVKTSHSSRKSKDLVSSLYAGSPSAERDLKQHRSSRTRLSAQSKREPEQLTCIGQENIKPPIIYHPWESSYRNLFCREKYLKPMTKDPYTRIGRFISHAAANVTTEIECCPFLTAAETVKVETVDVQQAPRTSVHSTVRYLRTKDLLPSEKSTSGKSPMKLPSLSRYPNKGANVSFKTANQTDDSSALKSIGTNRLLQRQKVDIDTAAIRRPARKLILNVTHETIVPLSVYA